MKSKPECIICSLKQVLSTAKRITSDPALQKKALDSAMIYLKDQVLTITPAELASDLFHLTCRELKQQDPFRPDMDDYNQRVLELFPKLRRILDNSGDRIFQAILMAVAGNLIDLGIISEVNVDETIDSVLRTGLKVNDYHQLKEVLDKSKNLLYIADNAGEIVFDKLLLEEIKKSYPLIKITLAVKSGPAANDALRCDAVAAGISQVATIIETGADCLGIPEGRCGVEFWNRFAAADVVIAKGHANFETIIPNGHPVFVLLRAKCEMVAAELGVGVHDSVLKRYY
jgi:uncharacterized protein with ATP-grasp and redox domains